MTPGSGGRGLLLPLLTFGLVSLLLSPVAAVIYPRPQAWSTKTFGPDGPWNAVEVAIDSQAKIALFPGRMWHTVVLTTDYCALNAPVAHCEAGTYNAARVTSSIGWRPPPQELMAGIEVRGDSAGQFLGNVDVGFSTVRSASFVMIDSQMLVYPDGQGYPAFAGCLSLGAPGNQTFSRGSGMPPINGTMIPAELAKGGLVSSASVGMHIGSAAFSAKMAGSLYWGGYDRNRIVGDILTIDGEEISTPRLLKDISIQVVKGSSPFNFTSNQQAGLLANNNASITSPGLPVVVDACSPYLTLPKSTCDSIAAYLPVTYVPSLGLYTWNTNDPKYAQIVNSPSVLSFTFIGQTNTQTITINVPFKHLNLTLAPPLVPSSIPYFPCFTGGTGTYVLGRAFLQDAFFGVNWDTRKSWLAQAPGPNIQIGSDAQPINPTDVAISKSANDWLTSWDGFWTELTPAQVSDTPPPASSSSSSSNSNNNGPGDAQRQNTGNTEPMSVASKAGIAVGAVAGFLLLLGAGIFLWRRAVKHRDDITDPSGPGGVGYIGGSREIPYGTAEVAGTIPQMKSYYGGEMVTPHTAGTTTGTPYSADSATMYSSEGGGTQGDMRQHGSAGWMPPPPPVPPQRPVYEM
ncbi:aspartic peptidase domain-containing protein [Podospora didyma]|uniref:Aspartic peptidase domain-containing protein n=1 Tax=Podospora didyma TaxID=330526 RepID=A0AAE0U8Q1_9PEZI|nr:aspartic peptidase domain-containing protein [Podospora didyma]